MKIYGLVLLFVVCSEFVIREHLQGWQCFEAPLCSLRSGGRSPEQLNDFCLEN